MKKTIYRSAITGKIVTKQFAIDNPTITVKEEVGKQLSEIKKVLLTDATPEQMVAQIKSIVG